MASHIWWWRLGMAGLTALGLWWLWTVNLPAFVILAFIAFFIGLPVLLWIDLPLWGLMGLAFIVLTVTAVVDVVTQPRILTRPENRIAFIILGFDAVIIGLVALVIYVL